MQESNILTLSQRESNSSALHIPKNVAPKIMVVYTIRSREHVILNLCHRSRFWTDAIFAVHIR